MIMREGQKQILELDPDCQILRNGSPTSLESLRPVFAQSYQDVLCWLNNQGFISYILANYSVEEVDGSLVSRDIFGNVK